MNLNKIIARNALDIDNQEPLITGNNYSPIDGKVWNRKAVIMDKCNQIFYGVKEFICDTASRVKKIITKRCVSDIDMKVALNKDIKKKINIYYTYTDNLQHLKKDLDFDLVKMSNVELLVSEEKSKYAYAIEQQRIGEKNKSNTCWLAFICRALDRSNVKNAIHSLNSVTKDQEWTIKEANARLKKYRDLKKVADESFESLRTLIERSTSDFELKSQYTKTDINTNKNEIAGLQEKIDRYKEGMEINKGLYNTLTSELNVAQASLKRNTRILQYAEDNIKLLNNALLKAKRLSVKPKQPCDPVNNSVLNRV